LIIDSIAQNQIVFLTASDSEAYVFLNSDFWIEEGIAFYGIDLVSK
jgi:hypothetical protein|tara:strand:- start:453 stop:590 length:138 start_codon:yes stop_codon:yes gene_type:complete